MKTLFDILGWSGSGLIILAYALTLIENRKYVELGKYMNLLGGLFIALNCYHYNAIPPFVTNLLWSIIATLTIYKTRKEKRKYQITENTLNENIGHRRKWNHR